MKFHVYLTINEFYRPNIHNVLHSFNLTPFTSYQTISKQSIITLTKSSQCLQLNFTSISINIHPCFTTYKHILVKEYVLLMMSNDIYSAIKFNKVNDKFSFC